MLKNLLVLILVCSSVSVFAKSNQRGGVKVPLKFDIKYYNQLTYANRDKYLKILNELALKIEKSQHSRKTASNSFDLQSLLLPYAEAANRTCIYGGIAMQMASCPKTLASVPAEYSNTEFFSCAAGQNRCSLASGISSSGKGYCYANTVVMATAECEKMAKADVQAGMGGTERLTAALDKCQKFPTSSAVNCSDIIRALTKDTEAMATYCGSKNSSYCAIAKTQIAKLNPYVGSGASVTALPASVGGRDGCAEAEQTVIGDTLGTSGVSPMWMKLITMTRQTCSGTSGILIDDQLKRFGVCADLTAPSGMEGDVESTIAKQQYLGPAIGKMMTPGAGALDNNEKSAFQNYFGITPNEYNKLFCESSSTSEFYDKLGAVVDDPSKPAGETLDEKGLLTWFLGTDDLAARVAAIPSDSRSANFRTALNNYTSVLADYKKAGEEYELYSDACASGSKPVTCAKIPNMTDIAAKRFKALQALQKEFEKAKASSMNLEALIGKSNVDAAKSAVNKNARGISESAYAQRAKFKKCVASAVTTRMGGKGRLKSEEAVSNVGKDCRQSLVTKIDGRTKYGKLYIMDNAKNKCFVSDGIPKPDSKCPAPGRASIATNFGASGSPSDNICLDNSTLASNYTIFTYTCGGAAPSDLPASGSSRIDEK
jgi:hypothetical protein